MKSRPRAIPWDETKLKAKLMEQMRDTLDPEGFICLRHEDSFTSGVPDISVTGPHTKRFTSWFEGKHANPSFKSRSQQDLTMLRLAHAGIAFYIIWDEGKHHEYERTLIVEPKNFGHWKERAFEVVEGFNHRFVIDFIRRLHTS